MKTSKTNAFTLIELLVVISIIAILAGIALPVFSTVLVRGQQTKSLSNAKQIGLACKLYAMDNSGMFPSYQLDPTTLQPSTPLVPVTSSNLAFAQLFPDYLQNEQLFFTPGSAFTLLPPDNKIDNPMTATPTETLKSGENTWAYILALTETSNSLFPLIFDGYSPGTEGTCTYVADKTAKGGVWEGKKAIVLRCDMSAAVEKVDSKLKSVKGNPVDPTKSIFDNAGAAAAGGGQVWLGSTNKPVNPL